jgi:diguanylate cyclase (GGDEF)-like protein
MQDMARGNSTAPLSSHNSPGEIARLIEHFLRLARIQQETREELESKVVERTEALDRLANTDPLTGLLNRRGMNERIEAEISRSRREQSHIGLLWLDIDLFKQINDEHGHAKGDAALKAVATTLNSLLRPYDNISRWGGDEFLALIPANDARDVDALGERIRSTIADACQLQDANGAPLRLSVSIGGYFADSREDMESMLQRADKALYFAKASGRNCYRGWVDSLARTPPGAAG